MCEAHKPDQWPKVVQDAIDSGGKVCSFQDVPVKGDCLVQIGVDWFGGIKLPKLTGGSINFVAVDERAPWSHRLWAIPLDTTVVFIPEAKPVEETVDTTYGNPTPDSAGPGAPFNC